MTKSTGVGRGGGWLKTRRPGREALIKKLYVEDLYPAKEVACRVGVSREVVYGALKRLGVPRRTGLESRIIAYGDPVERFWGFVKKDPDSGCWPWQGCASKAGYGQFVPRKGVQMQAPRYSYELHKGPIPRGLHLDHLCRNPICVNPDHLEAVTPRENNLRGISPAAINAKKTHCKSGHLLDEGNVYLYFKKGAPRPSRLCRICRLEASRRFMLHKTHRNRGLVQWREDSDNTPST